MAHANPKSKQPAPRVAPPKPVEPPLMFGTAYDLDPYLERLQQEIARIDRKQVRRLAELIREGVASECTRQQRSPKAAAIIG